MARAASPRAVVFDLGGTIVSERDFNEVEQRAKESGIERDAEAITHAYREVVEEFDRAGRPMSGTAFWREVFGRAPGEAPIPPDAVDRFVAVVDAEGETTERFSDVERTLKELKRRGFTLAVLTNGRSEARTKEILKRAGVGSYFQEVVAAGTEGVAKPDPRIFLAVAKRLGVAPGEIVYVGDLERIDAKAAIAAGLVGVWLNRDGWGFGVDPPEITSLTELPGWIERNSGRSR